jgi:hypothetical protein
VVIAIGSNAVYGLSHNLADQYPQTHDLETQGKEFYVPFAPANLTVRIYSSKPSLRLRIRV